MIGLIGLLLDGIIRLAQRIVMPWRGEDRL